MNPRFAETVVCVAWGLTNGQWTPDELAGLCQRFNVAGVCYQVITENDDYGPALHDACRSRNIHFGGWTNVPQQVHSDDDLTALFQRIDAYKCGFFAANVEERWTYGGTVVNADGTITDPNECHLRFASKFRTRYPTKPACVQTNFGGFERRDADGKIVPGYDRVVQEIYTRFRFDCQHEDYTVDNPNSTPKNGDFTANNQWGLQFPGASSSMIGVYGGWHIRDYRQALIDSGRSRVQWVYLPEEMDDPGVAGGDWQAIGKPL